MSLSAETQDSLPPGPPLHSACRPMSHVQSVTNYTFPACFFFSKGYHNSLWSNMLPLFIWGSAVYKEPVSRSLQPEPIMYFLRFLWPAFLKSWNMILDFFILHSKPIWYLLLYWWQNLSIQQLQLSWGFDSTPMAPRTHETSCNEIPTTHFVSFIIP